MPTDYRRVEMVGPSSWSLVRKPNGDELWLPTSDVGARDSIEETHSRWWGGRFIKKNGGRTLYWAAPTKAKLAELLLEELTFDVVTDGGWDEPEVREDLADRGYQGLVDLYDALNKFTARRSNARRRRMH